MSHKSHANASNSTSNPDEEFEDISAVLAELGLGVLEHFRDVRLEEIIARESKALVKGLLHRGDAAISYGESMAGKTFGVLDLAWHLAMGKAWHGG